MERTMTSNRRQPARQARTNPQRTTSQLVTVVPATDVHDSPPPEEHGFFPAITHFTDSITALPREMIRHYTMLKEVDAKIYGPEERLSKMLDVGNKSEAPRSESSPNQFEPMPEPTSSEFTHPRFARRRHFLNMRHELAGILQTQDEKSHVMSTAIECLEKQLQRCQSSFPHIEQEISEDARLGSMTHWAYNTEKPPIEKKSMIGSERTRRAANQAAAEHERQAITARKGRNQFNDSDADDLRYNTKRVQSAAKGRVQGLGIKSAVPPNKKRRIEGSVEMKRSISSAFGSNARGASPAVDNKKKPRNGASTANNRRRGGTNDSPNLASSPVMGTFTTGSKDHRKNQSPAPSLMQRVPSSRARQNSTQTNKNASRNGSTSIAHARAVNGNGHSTHADLERLASFAGKSNVEVRHMKEIMTTRGDAMQEDSNADGLTEVRGVAAAENQNGRHNSSSAGTSRTRGDRPPSISTRGGGAGPGSKNPSKNPTPLTASFDTRPSRPAAPTKRSHKKGAGLAAQLARAQAAAHDGVDGDGDGDIEMEEELTGDGNEQRYCYCNDISYGEMVGCDNDDCQKEWFHLSCVGLSKPPGKNTKWYCEDCKELMRKR